MFIKEFKWWQVFHLKKDFDLIIGLKAKFDIFGI
jgi:hypothetical protein